MNVYGSSILNSQKVETTQMATSRWVNDGIWAKVVFKKEKKKKGVNLHKIQNDSL